MANTYVLISSNTLTSTTATVTFSSIPATYTDLVLRISARGPESFIYLKFNGDGTTTKYSSTYLRGNGSAASSSRSSNADVFPIYSGDNLDSYTANTFSNTEIYIPSYTASQNKPMSGFGVAETNASAANYVGLNAGLYSSTTAISSIEINMGGVSAFVSGSSFYLYGIKNS